MFGARDITLKTGGDILPFGLKVAGTRGTPLAPGPEQTLGVLSTAGLTRLHGGLSVGRADLGVVPKVRRVLLITETVWRGTLVTRGTV